MAVISQMCYWRPHSHC